MKNTEEKYNYNAKLISALHSFFWYEGLLDTDKDANGEDEYIAFDKNGNIITDSQTNPDYLMSRPKYSDNCVILQLIKKLQEFKRDKDHYYFNFDLGNAIFENHNEDFSNRYTELWQMLVEMFGECGTSPRYGWIENTNGAAEFLDIVVRYEELNYLNKL